MNPQKMLGLEDGEVFSGVSNGEWLETVFEKLLRPEAIGAIKTTKTFKAKLRRYQQDGLNWLFYLHKLKFGACLADDMGLGKTVQVLAFLNVLKTEQKKEGGIAAASLLVIPASLLANWTDKITLYYCERLRFY